jgi:hypothetical protein|tara:strand:- start:1175 stop:1414 length:240 start_codon:yes stop_codon:yes gene_type:complete
MKAVLKIGYTDYVVDVARATEIMDLIQNSERYEKHWDGTSGTNNYHIWNEQKEVDTTNLELIPDKLYQMAKLAGAPAEG